MTERELHDDELLSAFLDGEVTEAERARAERLLAERPDMRQLLDELRAVRGGVQGLERHRLDDDFAAGVLRQAERAVLTGEDAGGSSPASVAPFSWRRLRRPLFWSAAAIAAALAVMFINPSINGPRVGERERIAHTREADKPARRLGRESVIRALPDGDASGALIGEEITPSDEARASGRFSDTVSGSTSGSVAGGASGGAADRVTSFGSEAAPPRSGVAGVTAPATPSLDAAPPAAAASETFAGRGVDAYVADDEVMVVQVRLTPAAVRAGAFDKVLASQQITWRAADHGLATPAPAEQQPEASAVRRREALGEASREPSAAESLADQPENSLAETPDNEPEAGLGYSFSGGVRNSDAQNVELVYVETTPAQLEATLSDLHAKPAYFATVDVEPASQEYSVELDQAVNAGQAAPAIEYLERNGDITLQFRKGVEFKDGAVMDLEAANGAADGRGLRSLAEHAAGADSVTPLARDAAEPSPRGQQPTGEAKPESTAGKSAHPPSQRDAKQPQIEAFYAKPGGVGESSGYAQRLYIVPQTEGVAPTLAERQTQLGAAIQLQTRATPPSDEALANSLSQLRAKGQRSAKGAVRQRALFLLQVVEPAQTANEAPAPVADEPAAPDEK